MIEIKIENVHIHVGSLKDLENISPWFNLPSKVEESADRGDYSADTGVEEQIKTNIISFDVDTLPNTHISEIAKQYASELNSSKSSSENKSQPSMLDPYFFDKDENGLYDLSKQDHLEGQYNDIPDVEIVTDEYERQMQQVVERANLRYATYQNSKIR